MRAKLEPGIPKSRKAIEDLPKRLDKKFWDGENRELLAVILPLLSEAAENAALFSAETIEGATGIGVDWALVNTEAVKWARGYAGELIKGINETTRNNVRQHVAEFIETPGATIGDLRRKLAQLPSFNDNRARMVAVTETTRSYFEGSMATVRTYENEGLFTWEKRWNTVLDGLVCDICRPLHRKKVKGLEALFDTLVGPLQGPPAHPRCRCSASFIPIVGEEAAPEWKPAMSVTEARAWAPKSAIKEDQYHGTSRSAAKGIKKDGFSLDFEGAGRVFGEGVYVTSDPEYASKYAERAEAAGETLQIAINVKNPYIAPEGKGVDLIDMGLSDTPKHVPFISFAEKAAKELGLPVEDVAKAATRWMQKRGYDAYVGMEYGIDYTKRHPMINVFDPKDVTVIGK